MALPVYKRRKGVEYIPPILLGETVEELRSEMQRELENLASLVEDLQEINLIPQGKEPKRFNKGSVRYFEAGVSITGVETTSEGLYVFEPNSWRKV